MNPSIPIITRRQELPGFAEAWQAAVIRQQENREHAFIPYRRTVAGFPVRRLTLRLWALLDGLENPLVAGGHISRADALAALWVLSPKFVPGKGILARWRRACHNARYHLIALHWLRRGLDFDIVAHTARFFEDAFLDAPGGPPDPGFGNLKRKPPAPPFTAIWADCVDMLATAYGWPEEIIVNLPLQCLWQYRTNIIQRQDPDYIPNQLTDVVNRDYARRFKRYQDSLAETENSPAIPEPSVASATLQA